MQQIKERLIAFRETIGERSTKMPRIRPPGIRQYRPEGYTPADIIVTFAYAAGIAATQEPELRSAFEELDNLRKTFHPVCSFNKTAVSDFREGLKFGASEDCTALHVAYSYSKVFDTLSYGGGYTFKADKDVQENEEWFRWCTSPERAYRVWDNTLDKFPAEFLKVDPVKCGKHTLEHWGYAAEHVSIYTTPEEGWEHIRTATFHALILLAALGQPHLMKSVWEQARRLQYCLFMGKEKTVPLILQRI